MIFLSPSHQQLIRTFIDHQVNFVVVGGLALIYYGVNHSTGTLELLIEPTRQNGERVIKAFSALQLDVNDLLPEEFEKPIFLAFGFEPNAVDLLTFTPAISYDEAKQSPSVVSIENLRIPVINIDLLIKNKANLNRKGSKALLDEYDVQELTRIKNQRS
jgi:hypothetical protein